MIYPDEVLMSQYPAPAFDEPACTKHPSRAAVPPIAFRRCAECQKNAQNAYAERRITKYDDRDDTAPDGRLLRKYDR